MCSAPTSSLEACPKSQVPISCVSVSPASQQLTPSSQDLPEANDVQVCSGYWLWFLLQNVRNIWFSHLFLRRIYLSLKALQPFPQNVCSNMYLFFFFLVTGLSLWSPGYYGVSNLPVTGIAGYANIPSVFVFFLAPCGLHCLYYLTFASLELVF